MPGILKYDMTGWKMSEHGVPDSRITVINRDLTKISNIAYWNCRCDCGQLFSCRGTAIRSGKAKSCGCLHSEISAHIGHKNGKNLINKIFGALTVIEKTSKRYKRQIVWKCECACGRIKEVATNDLIRGHVTSCGCKRRSFAMGKIKEILDKNNIVYLEDSPYFEDLKTSEEGVGRYDFILFKEDKPFRLIEYDGEFHYKTVPAFGGEKTLLKTLERDKIKNDYALSHNIPLVRIPYTERDNITLETIIGDKYLIT